jgi:hypothetical protein
MAKANQQLQVATPRSDGGFSIQSIDPAQVSGMPLAQYYQMAGNFVNVQNAVYYDTAVYTAGTAITNAQKKRLFTKGKDQDDTVVNTGVAIPEKGEFMTNMISDGEFEGGTTFILEQIAVNFILTGEQPTTLGTRGEITAPNYVASVVISPANHAKAIVEQFELQFVRNEDVKLRAKVKHFPSPFGLSGDFGSPNGSFVQNGGPNFRWNMLSRAVVLQSEDKFSLVLNPIVATWTPTASFNLTVELIGKKITTQTP